MHRDFPFYDEINYEEHRRWVRERNTRIITLRWLFRAIIAALLAVIFVERIEIILTTVSLCCCVVVCRYLTALTQFAALDVMRMKQFQDYLASQKDDHE